MEVTIALVVLLIVLVAVSGLLVTSFQVGADSRYRAEADNVATSILDGQVQKGAAVLLNEIGDTALGTVATGGTTFTLEREVSPDVPGSSTCVSPASDPQAMLLVTIWATWSPVGSSAKWWSPGSSAYTSRQVKASGLVAIPQNDFNSSEAALLVTVTGATGEPISGVAVTVTGPGSPPQTATLTTTSAGCVVFSNLTPGTWSISGTEPGYIDSADDWNTSTQAPAAFSMTGVTLTAGVTTTEAFSYDRTASATAVYSLSQGTLPVGLVLPLSFYPLNLSPCPITGGCPLVERTPSLVYPYATNPSYYVVAGSCGPESDPNDTGGVSDGVPVTLSPGSAATVTIGLVPMTVVVTHGGSPVAGATVYAAVPNGDANCPPSGAATAMPTIDLGTTACNPGPCVVGGAYVPDGPVDAQLVSHGGGGGGGGGAYCSSAVAVSSSVNPSTTGKSVTFTATVTDNSFFFNCSFAGSPTGSVTFMDGSTVLKTVALSSGSASYTTSTLAAGNHTITVNYSGDSNFRTSTSPVLTQVVDTSAPTTTSGTTTTTPPTTTTTSPPVVVTSSSPIVASGLPYGKFVVSAIYNGASAPSPVTVVVTPAGIYVNGAAHPVPPGSTITVAD